MKATVLFFFLLINVKTYMAYADRGIDGRHSYTLTTFDTKGKLGQVERAMEAAQRGTPIVAVCTNTNDSAGTSSGVILAAPQVLPSPLALDDGTPRFARITDEIVVAHTGLAADGRILTAAAQRLAVEHEYTFDENVDIAIFLEEMALLLQSYTAKPAARPFGASLVVAFVPATDLCLKPEPKLYRIDPSGNVDAFEGPVALVHGGSLDRETQLREQLQHIVHESDQHTTSSDTSSNRAKVVAALQQALRQQAKKRGQNHSRNDNNDDDNNNNIYRDLTILTASLYRTERNGSVFRTTRHEPEDDE